MFLFFRRLGYLNKMLYLLWDIDNDLRSLIKYESTYEDTIKGLENIRAMIYDTVPMDDLMGDS